MTSPFLKAARPSGNFLKFSNVGDSHTIQITGPYTERQQTEYVPGGGQGAPRVYPSGDPILEYLVPGLDYNAESEEDANAVLVIKSKRQMQALGKALQDAGVDDLRTGGVLTMTFTGFGPATGGNPPKEYEAKYVAPEPTENPWN